MSLFSLKQVINSLIRITSTSESLLDLMLISFCVEVVESSANDTFYISDHYAIYAAMRCFASVKEISLL